MRRRSAGLGPAGIAMAWALLAASAPCAAQVQALDPTLIGAVSLSGRDREQLSSFVAAHSADVTSDDFAQVRRARTALLAPLDQPGVSVSFREAYSGVLWPTVEELLGSDDAAQRLTGMRLAGKLGTEQAADQLIALLQEDDEGIRVFAAGRLGDVLATVGPNTGAISPDGAARVIDALGKTIREDRQARAADAAARSLEVAAAIRPGTLNDARSRAIRVLSESAGARIAGFELDEDAMGLALRSCGIVRTTLNLNEPISADAARAAIGLGAEVIAGAVREMDDEERRGLQVRAVRAAENLVFFGRRRHAEASGDRGAAIPTTDLATALASTETRVFRGFRREAVALLGDLKSDYGFGADRFRLEP